jgi:hypothetical protein
MREDELQRQMAELVADHADQAMPPSVAAIRRRGRLRRARLASGAVLLIAVVAVGLVAVQGPLDRRTTPAPVVTQPPRPIQPSSGFADYVRGRFDDMLVDMTVVALAGGKAGGEDWQLAAVRGTSRRSHEAKVCIAHKTDGRSHGYGYSCRDEASNRVMDRMTSGGGAKEMPLWGLVPEATARVRLLRPGASPVEVPAMGIGPGFRRRYYLAPPTPGVRTLLALDAQGHEIARFPPVP